VGGIPPGGTRAAGDLSGDEDSGPAVVAGADANVSAAVGPVAGVLEDAGPPGPPQPATARVIDAVAISKTIRLITRSNRPGGPAPTGSRR